MALIGRLEYSDEEARATLAQAGAAARNPSEYPIIKQALVKAASLWMAYLRRRFITASRGDGTWEPLSLTTKIRRLRKQASLPFSRLRRAMRQTKEPSRIKQLAALAATRKFDILVVTRRLLNSISESSPEVVMRFERGRGIEISTRVPYHLHHQEGGKIPGHPPKRLIYVQPDQATADKMQGQVTRAYEEIFRARRSAAKNQGKKGGDRGAK